MWGRQWVGPARSGVPCRAMCARLLTSCEAISPRFHKRGHGRSARLLPSAASGFLSASPEPGRRRILTAHHFPQRQVSQDRMGVPRRCHITIATSTRFAAAMLKKISRTRSAARLPSGEMGAVFLAGIVVSGGLRRERRSAVRALPSRNSPMPNPRVRRGRLRCVAAGKKSAQAACECPLFPVVR